MKETVVGIKKLITRITFIAGIMTVLLVSACKDGFEILPEQPEMAKVSIKVMGNNGRTVNPSLPNRSEITKYELRGSKKDQIETPLLEFNTQSESIYLELGEWRFTLNAYRDNEIILSGILEKEIINGDDNILTFYLFPLNDGNGAIIITFTFPEDVGFTFVNVNSDPSLHNELSQDKEITTSGKFIFTDADVSAGDYFIVFRFYDGNFYPARIISELVRVRSNLTSTKTIELQGFTKDVPGENLDSKLKWLEENAEDGGEYTVTVTGTETITGQKYLGYQENTINVSITLTGGGTVNLSAQEGNFDSRTWINIDPKVKLTLENITLQGSPYNYRPVISVRGELVMNNNAQITGNTTNTDYVNDTDSGRGIEAGGVFVGEGGKFTMNGGTISGNTSKNGGGVSIWKGTFTMSGGEISGNTATEKGGGVYVQNGGTFTKASTGGTINGYTGDTKSNAVIDSSGRVQNNNGHAVYIDDNHRRDGTVNSYEELSYNGETFTGTWDKEPIKITIAAIQGVTAPAIGGTPVTVITENEQYSGTVTWSDNPSTFAASITYTATITLSAKIGYTLQKVAANFFTVAGATSVSGDWDANGNYGAITAVFPAIINIAAIQGVTAPAIGGTPVTVITENEQYNGTVTWSDNPSTFAASITYTATITLTAKTDYTLQGVAANFFTVAGATSVSNNANSGIITAVFPAVSPPIIDSTLNVTFTGPTDQVITVTKNIVNNLSQSGGGSVTLRITEHFDKYAWYIGGTKVGESTTQDYIILSAFHDDFQLGINWITVVVYTGETPWSGKIAVMVNE